MITRCVNDNYVYMHVSSHLTDNIIDDTSSTRLTECKTTVRGPMTEC